MYTVKDSAVVMLISEPKWPMIKTLWAFIFLVTAQTIYLRINLGFEKIIIKEHYCNLNCVVLQMKNSLRMGLSMQLLIGYPA